MAGPIGQLVPVDNSQIKGPIGVLTPVGDLTPVEPEMSLGDFLSQAGTSLAKDFSPPTNLKDATSLALRSSLGPLGTLPEILKGLDLTNRLAGASLRQGVTAYKAGEPVLPNILKGVQGKEVTDAQFYKAFPTAKEFQNKSIAAQQKVADQVRASLPAGLPQNLLRQAIPQVSNADPLKTAFDLGIDLTNLPLGFLGKALKAVKPVEEAGVAAQDAVKIAGLLPQHAATSATQNVSAIQLPQVLDIIKSPVNPLEDSALNLSKDLTKSLPVEGSSEILPKLLDKLPEGGTPPPVNASTAKQAIIRPTQEGHPSFVEPIVDSAKYENTPVKDRWKFWKPSPGSKYKPEYRLMTRNNMFVSQTGLSPSVGTVLKKVSPEGERLANMLDDAFNTRQALFGDWQVKAMDAIDKVDDKTFANATKILEGGTGTPQEQQIATQLKGILDEVGNSAVQYNPKFNLKENYWVHKGTPEFQKLISTDKGKVWYEKWLTKNNPDLSEEQIGQILKEVSNKTPSFKYGPLVYERKNVIPEQYIRRDKAALLEYLDGASRYIADVKHLGEDNALATKVANDIINDADRDFAQQVVKTYGSLGKPQPNDKFYTNARKFQTLTKMGPLSSMRNYLQRLNMLGVKGSSFTRTLKSLIEMHSQDAERLALQAGVIPYKGNATKFADPLVSDLGSKLVETHLGLSGYNAFERGNRKASTVLGKNIAGDFFKVLTKDPKDTWAREILEEMGVDVKSALSRGSLSTNDTLNAARKVTGDMNFFSRVTDLPLPYTSTGLGKTLTQFKSAAYQQSNFLGKVFKEALKNPQSKLNLLYLLAAMQATGEGANDITAAVRNRDRPQGIPRIIENFAAGSGIGLLADTLMLASRGSDQIAGTFSGPTGQDVSETIYTIANPKQLPENLPEYLRKRIPWVGTLTPKIKISK